MGLVKKDEFKKALQGKTGKRRKSAHSAAKIAGAAAGAKINDLLPDLPTTTRLITALKVPDKRIKKQSSDLVEKLVKSIAADGQINALLIHDGEVLDGAARLEALKALGATHAKVKDLSFMPRSKAQRIAISVNRTAQIAEWDLEGTREAIILIEADGYNLDATGFDDIELDILKLDPLEEGLSDELNDVPEPLETCPVSRLGDRWQLGKHVLLVGDATKAESYATLLGDRKVALVVTDPPFNVPIAGHVSGLGKVKHQDFVMGCGEQSPAEFTQFLTTCLAHMHAVMIEGGVAYVFIDWRHVSQMVLAGAAAGLTLINIVVWNKMSGGMGAMLRSQHELAPMFCAGASPAKNKVQLGANGRDRTNVWSFPGANRANSSANEVLKEHPTPKPVEMIVDGILDVTDPDDIVLDPFLGSGTTIIAAEECQRIAYGMELDPKYADVIIRRYEALTGTQATLTDTGETFAEVKARREEGSEANSLGDEDNDY